MTLTVFYRNTFVSREINPEQTVWFLTINDKFKWISPNFWHLRNSFLPLPHSRTWVPLHLIFCGAHSDKRVLYWTWPEQTVPGFAGESSSCFYFFFFWWDTKKRELNTEWFLSTFFKYIYSVFTRLHIHTLSIFSRNSTQSSKLKTGTAFTVK